MARVILGHGIARQDTVSGKDPTITGFTTVERQGDKTLPLHPDISLGPSPTSLGAQYTIGRPQNSTAEATTTSPSVVCSAKMHFSDKKGRHIMTGRTRRYTVTKRYFGTYFLDTGAFVLIFSQSCMTSLYLPMVHLLDVCIVHTAGIRYLVSKALAQGCMLTVGRHQIDLLVLDTPKYDVILMMD